MLKLFKKIMTYKDRLIVTLLLNATALNVMAADELDIAQDSSDYLMKYLIGIAIIVLPVQIIFQLLQVKTGRKEPMEAVTPIVWTTLIVATPPICNAVVTLLQSHLGSNQL